MDGTDAVMLSEEKAGSTNMIHVITSEDMKEFI